MTNETNDKIALKELIDQVSILGDQKDFKNQVQLFTEDAISETISGGLTILELKGRRAMEKAFGEFTSAFHTVYHFNGQQKIELTGDQATGICYCMITLIGDVAGKSIRTTVAATYEDEYVRTDNKWLIARRIGTFHWQEKRELI